MLESAVIEVRQHLCCANVFLKFKHSLADIETLKIFVDKTKVKLQNPKCSAEILVNKFFSILAGTFSNLVVDAENASFRISVEDIQLSKLTDCSKTDHLQLNLAEQVEASVTCSNCDAVLASAQKYDKIREFPSGAIDVSEFFCHHGPNFKDILVPSITEMFYGFQFIVLNMETIRKTTRDKENHLYCRRCLKYLGETLNDRAAKIWGDSVCFGTKDQAKQIFSSDDQSKISKLLLKAIEETSLPAPEPLLRNMHFTKVLLQATFPNRQQQYLLVHILEKQLPVLRNIDNAQSESQLAELLTQTTCLELMQNRAFKILYRLIANNAKICDKVSSKWPPILEYWQQDINILKMKISPDLFNDFTKELNKNINIFPKVYRVNNDDFLMSYIFY